MKEMTVRVVPPEKSDKLLDRQWRAKIYFMACPFRRALNQRWKQYFKDKVNFNNGFEN